MKKPPNFNSWITLQPFVKRASMQDVYDMITHESNGLKRSYILKRLVSAFLSKYRAQLHKTHIKSTTKKAKP
jgi:hypothetical protein